MTAMHDTAMANGRRFFLTYMPEARGQTIVDIGAQDVNVSLRQVAPPSNTYVRVDFVAAPGVDVVMTDPYRIPLEDGSTDAVVTSSVFEHSEFFWLLFHDILRVLKPSGLL
jgi:SAM-dependent methyltransferase